MMMTMMTMMLLLLLLLLMSSLFAVAAAALGGSRRSGWSWRRAGSGIAASTTGRRISGARIAFSTCQSFLVLAVRWIFGRRPTK